MDEDKFCRLCGRNGSTDPLECHHIFGGPYRSKSEKYGLTVWLCGNECHRLGEYAAHVNPETRLQLRQYGQEKAMEDQGWSIQDFIKEFGKNYLEE